MRVRGYIVAAALPILPYTMAVADDTPVLKVEAISPKGSGTMHFSEELRLWLSVSAGGFASVTGAR